MQYEVKQIGEGAFFLSEKFSTMFVLTGSLRALLIDCGLGVGDYRAEAERLTRGLPYDFVATHAHVDHIGGRGQFETMYISETESRRIGKCGLGARRRWLLRKKITGAAPKDVFVRKDVREPEVRIIKEGDVFDLGDGREVEVISTPGHTGGSVSLYDRKYKILYAGDAVSSYLYLWLPESGFVEEERKTLEKIAALDFSLIWPSHHRRPFDRERFQGVYETVKKLSEQKNSPLPKVKRFTQQGNQVIYRTDRIR